MSRDSSGDRDEDAVTREYARLAHVYDTRWAFYVGATTRETLERLDLSPSDRLLDVGCGTGALLEALSRRLPTVELVGVDLCPQMLDLAQQEMGERAELVAAHAEDLPFPDGNFDVLVSCNAFHYFRRPEKALAEFRRVLKSGGRLVVTDWCDDYLACRLLDCFLRVFNRAHFRTYGEGECRRLLLDTGFEQVQVERYKISRLWGLMTATARRGHGPDHRGPIEAGDP